MFLANMSLLNPTDLQRIFEKLDKNGDGFVSLEELNWLLDKIGFQFSSEELESLVGNKSLDFIEFSFFYDSISNRNNNNGESRGGYNGNDDEIEELESDLVKAFEVFDLDGDGFITSQELECVLKRLGLWDERSCKDSRSMICFYDTNLDGQLDFGEFKNMMLPTPA